MNIRKKVLEILQKSGFEVQDTSYDHQLENTNLNYLKDIELPNNDAANLLRYHPDYFVVHRQIGPGKASFYVLCWNDKLPIPMQIIRLFKKYFPAEVLFVHKGNNNELVGKWLIDSKVSSELRQLVPSTLE